MSRYGDFDQQTQIQMNNSMDFSVNESLIHQLTSEDIKTEKTNQQQMEEKLEWIKKKSFQKKFKREGTQSLERMEEKKQDEKPGCAVYVRLRPDNGQEDGHSQCVIMKDQQSVEVINDQKTNTFSFDQVFNEGMNQEDIFKTVAKPLVHDFINGFNESILVYGQSGSGKTHTILGPGFDNLANINEMKKQLKNDPNHMHPAYGLVPRMVQAVFDNILKEQHSDKTYDVRLSYIEIYNEKIRDLLNTGGDEESKTRIYHDKDSNLVVCNATQVPIENSCRMLELIQEGSQRRRIGETDLNAHSSRSHAIIVLTCLTTISTSQEQTASQMLLIDLAGTENIERSGAQGIRVKEACNINTSLLALGNVIDDIINMGRYKEQLRMTTCEKAQKVLIDKIRHCHIGYRDSLLTRLLENCLGGNSYTRLICCASKSQLNLSETLSTLRFASRASQIKNKPKVNKKLSAEQLQRLLDHSRQQLKALTVLASHQSDQLDHYQQIIGQMMNMIPNQRMQISITNQLLKKTGYHCSVSKPNQERKELFKYIGKHPTLLVFSFLELPEITRLTGLNILVNQWLSRSDVFWKKQLQLLVKNKQIVLTHPDDITDSRMHINIHFNHLHMQKQKSKVKSNQAGLSLFRGTARN